MALISKNILRTYSNIMFFLHCLLHYTEVWILSR